MPGLLEGLTLSCLVYLKRPGYEEIFYIAAPSFAVAPSISKGLKATRQAGLTGIWHANREGMLPEGRTRTCQDAGGFIIISFVSP